MKAYSCDKHKSSLQPTEVCPLCYLEFREKYEELYRKAIAVSASVNSEFLRNGSQRHLVVKAVVELEGTLAKIEYESARQIDGAILGKMDTEADDG